MSNHSHPMPRQKLGQNQILVNPRLPHYASPTSDSQEGSAIIYEATTTGGGVYEHIGTTSLKKKKSPLFTQLVDDPVPGPPGRNNPQPGQQIDQ